MTNLNKSKILDKYLENKHSLKEWITLKEWFKNDQDYKELKNILQHKAALSGTANNSNSETINNLFNKIASDIWQKETLKAKTINIRNIILRVAAAVVIGLLIGNYVSSLSTKHQPVYYAAHSPKGSVSEMLLPDGSIIFLNAGSRIKYSIDGENGNREVFLTGEAWFDIAKDKEKPFVVRTPFYNINVTGTKFNVKAYEDDNNVTTTLEEGEIIVESSANFTLAEKVILKAGDQVILDKESNSVNIKTVNTKWFTSWKDNKLILVNMNLKEFIVILERKYGVDIEVDDDKILDMHVDCTIKNESIIEILDIIQKMLPVSYKIIGQEIIIKTNN